MCAPVLPSMAVPWVLMPSRDTPSRWLTVLSLGVKVSAYSLPASMVMALSEKLPTTPGASITTSGAVALATSCTRSWFPSAGVTPITVTPAGCSLADLSTDLMTPQPQTKFKIQIRFKFQSS
jgi:hypothetical protein